MRPPRAAFLNFPLGNSVGAPHEPEGQMRILRDVLNLAETVRQPGALLDLPYEWPDPTWEQLTIQTYRDEAHIVHNQRSRGEFTNGEFHMGRECTDVCSLV